jgi:hypothetical protein
MLLLGGGPCHPGGGVKLGRLFGHLGVANRLVVEASPWSSRIAGTLCATLAVVFKRHGLWGMEQSACRVSAWA